MADRRPGLGQPSGHDDPGKQVVIHNHIHFDLAPLVTLLTTIANAIQEIKHKMAELDIKLDALGTKFDTVTTTFGNTIDMAIARLAAEIAKIGTISPSAQLALDHLSGVADGLQALNQKTIDAFAEAPPVVVPPDGPIPPVEPLPPEVLASRRGR